MAENITNPSTSISYTNKDFRSIYIELLDLVKKLTYRWDPSISNESDPGVILIKLMALCSDKNNYNIDKNILEAFPSTVTQYPNARKLFEQLGYTMKWYKAASSTIQMKWVKQDDEEEEVTSYTVPRFTMVCDDDGSVVYSIVNENAIATSGEYSIFEVKQGIANELILNGNKLITPSYLDSYNRIYINDVNVAENGIYINNEGKDNFDDWEQVSNIAVQELGKRCYKFGVSDDGTSCYLEFPEDAETLMGSGINITYLKTDGEYGNVQRGLISKFYSDITVDGKLLNNENVKITNPTNIINGENPEDIDTAYRNYQKLVGTFNTLVTIRDYTNAAISSGIVSNGFVSDRTNDPQCSYNIMTSKNNVSIRKNVVGKDETSEEPLMTAFDLKMYLLDEVGTPTTPEEFNLGFEIVPNFGGSDENSSSIVNIVENYISDSRCIQHDFKHLELNKILFIKNKFPIFCRIYPQYKVTELQSNEILLNIYRALFKELSSKKMGFGEPADYDYIYDVITNADERIKLIALDDITYTPYAVYAEEENGRAVLKEYELSIDNIGTANDKFDSDIYAKSVLNGNTQLLIKDAKFAYNIQQESDTDSVVNNVKKVNTEVEIYMASDGSVAPYTASYTLRDNESISLLAPSLVEDKVYSSYVRYEYKLYNGVPSNSDYQLSGNESIVFFWKDSDEDDADYRFKKYGVGTIICPSFKLNANTNCPVTDALGTQKPNIDDGYTSNVSLTIEGEFISATEYIATYMTRQSLDGTKQITTKKKNQVEIDRVRNEFYFILNTKNSDGNYELFHDNEYVLDEQHYVLKANEYFIYTDINRASLNVLGSGTRITASGENHRMVCKPINIEDIYDGGVDVLSDYWIRVNQDSGVTLTEMQYYSFGANTTVILENSQYPIDLSFTNDGIFASGVQTSLGSSYTISYREKDREVVSIPNLILANEGWEGFSSLNLVTSQLYPQKILDNQYVVFSSPSEEILGEIVGSDSNPIYLLSDYPYDMDGSSHIDVSRLRGDGTYIYPSFYYYTLSEKPTPSEGSTVDYLSSGNVVINFKKTASVTSPSVEIPINLPRSSSASLTYLLPISITDGVSLDLGSHQTIQGESEISGAGEYYIMINMPTTSSEEVLELEADFSGSTISTLSVTIGEAYKYSPNEQLTPSQYSTVLGKLKSLDFDNMYDYTYQVDPDEKIENPLSAYDLLNSSHILNRNTICVMDTNNVDLAVNNKIKS